MRIPESALQILPRTVSRRQSTGRRRRSPARPSEKSLSSTAGQQPNGAAAGDVQFDANGHSPRGERRVHEGQNTDRPTRLSTRLRDAWEHSGQGYRRALGTRESGDSAALGSPGAIAPDQLLHGLAILPVERQHGL